MKKSLRDYLPNQSDDWWLISDTLDKVEEKEKVEGTGALSEPEQVVGTVWHSSGIIENGGLMYFFQFTFDVEEVARAYDAIGLPRLASILRTAIAKFPNGRRPKDFNKCMEFIDEHEEFFVTLSEKFLKDNEKIEKKLASYIKKHPKDFAKFIK